MPVVAMLIRVLIQAVVQTGIFVALDKTIGILVDKAKEQLSKLRNLTPEEAENTIANQVIDAFAMIGYIGAGIKSKLPTKAAEKLGFTSKGYSKRKLSAKAEQVSKELGTPKLATSNIAAAEIETISATIATSRGISVAKINSLLGIITKVVGVPTAVFFAAAQYIDFANWNGPYQGTFQKILSFITFGKFSPDNPMPNARAVSDDIWKRIYTTIEELGPLGISFPFSGVDKPYSRQALADLVNEVAANISASGGTANFKNVWGMVLPLIQLGGERGTTAFDPSKTLPTDEFVPNVRVFSGVVSQGKLGGDFLFTPRQDDLIENLIELQQAINNNLAPYLSMLAGRIIYEVKLVPTVLVDGIRQFGKTQTIQRGTLSNGKPRMQTVTNKFAVVDLYWKIDTDSRTKLDSIILGPVNAITFNPKTSDLAALSAAVPRKVVTSNTDEIGSMVSNTPTIVVPPATPSAPVSEPSIGYCFIYDGYQGQVCWNTATVDRLRNEIASGLKTLDQALDELRARHMKIPVGNTSVGGEDSWANNNQNHVRMAYDNGLELVKKMLSTGGTFSIKSTQPAEQSPPASYSVQTPAVPVVAPAQQTKTLSTAALSATTLSEFYQAQGKALPSLSERAALYQSFGLGQAAFYTGTAEQNTKLLYQLQNDPL